MVTVMAGINKVLKELGPLSRMKQKCTLIIHRTSIPQQKFTTEAKNCTLHNMQPMHTGK